MYLITRLYVAAVVGTLPHAKRMQLSKFGKIFTYMSSDGCLKGSVQILRDEYMFAIFKDVTLPRQSEGYFVVRVTCRTVVFHLSINRKF
jgi:hypothetical protein